MLAWRSGTGLCRLEGWSTLREEGCGSETAETAALVERLVAIVSEEALSDTEVPLTRLSAAARFEVRRVADLAEDDVGRLLLEVERIWALCEVALLTTRPEDRVVLLARWLREGCVDEVTAREEVEVLVRHFSQERAPERWRGEEEDDDDPQTTPFWQLAYKTLRRGDTSETWEVIGTHSAARKARAARTDPFHTEWAEVRAVLVEMPRASSTDHQTMGSGGGTNHQMGAKWARWKRRVATLRQSTALETVAPGVGALLAALDGDVGAVAAGASWEEVLLAQLTFAACAPADLDAVVVAAARREPRDVYAATLMEEDGVGDDDESAKNRALVEAVYDGDAAKTLEWVFVLSTDVGVVACAATLAKLFDAAGLLGDGGVPTRLTRSLVCDLAHRAEASAHYAGWKLALTVLETGLKPGPDRDARCVATLRRALPSTDAEASELAALCAGAGLRFEARGVLAARGDIALGQGQAGRAATLFARAELADNRGVFARDGHLERLCAECTARVTAVLSAELDAARRGSVAADHDDHPADDGAGHHHLGVAEAAAVAEVLAPREGFQDLDLAPEARFLAAYSPLADLVRRALRAGTGAAAAASSSSSSSSSSQDDDNNAEVTALLEAAAAALSGLVCASHPRAYTAHLLNVALVLLDRGAPFSSVAVTTLEHRLFEVEHAALRRIQDPLDPNVARWLKVALAHHLARAYVRENAKNVRKAKKPPAPQTKPKPCAFDLGVLDLLKPPPL